MTRLMFFRILAVLCITSIEAVDDPDCVFEQETCPCLGRANVVVVADRTGSMSNTEYAMTKKFLKKVMGRLALGDNSIKTAGYTFSKKTNPEWLFTDPASTSHPLVCEEIDNFKGLGGDTYTGRALVNARKAIQEVSATRPHVKCNVVFLITDGGSDNKGRALTQAQRLHTLGVKLCLVSVRDPNETPQQTLNRDQEIEGLLGPNGVNINAAQFVDLDGLVDQAAECICQCASQPCCSPPTVTTTEPKVTTTQPMPTFPPPTPPPPPPPPPPTTTPTPCIADVVFVVDTTGSMKGEEYSNYTAFLKSFLADLDMDNMQTALMQFARKPTIRWEFGDPESFDADAAVEEIDRLKPPKGDTYTHRALNRVKKLFKSPDVRPEACRNVALITDGGSDFKGKTEVAAVKLHQLGIKICVLSIRNQGEAPAQVANRDKEIQELVGSTGSNINTAGFADLEQVKADYEKCICECSTQA